MVAAQDTIEVLVVEGKIVVVVVQDKRTGVVVDMESTVVARGRVVDLDKIAEVVAGQDKIGLVVEDIVVVDIVVVDRGRVVDLDRSVVGVVAVPDMIAGAVEVAAQDMIAGVVADQGTLVDLDRFVVDQDKVVGDIAVAGVVD